MQNPNDTSVTVVGAGAIGGVTAAFLKKAGRNVKIVRKHQEIADRCAGQGIHVFGKKGEHPDSAESGEKYHRPEWPAGCDAPGHPAATRLTGRFIAG